MFFDFRNRAQNNYFSKPSCVFHFWNHASKDPLSKPSCVFNILQLQKNRKIVFHEILLFLKRCCFLIIIIVGPPWAGRTHRTETFFTNRKYRSTDVAPKTCCLLLCLGRMRVYDSIARRKTKLSIVVARSLAVPRGNIDYCWVARIAAAGLWRPSQMSATSARHFGRESRSKNKRLDCTGQLPGHAPWKTRLLLGRTNCGRWSMEAVT